MSENDDPLQDDSDLRELEQKLSRLKPAAPSEAFLNRMGNSLDAMDRTRAEDRIVWMRFAPVAAAACVVLTSAFLFRGHLLRQQEQVSGILEAPASGKWAAGMPAPVVDDQSTSGSPDFASDEWTLPSLTEFFFSDNEDGGNWFNAVPARPPHFVYKNDSHLFEPPASAGASIRTFSSGGDFNLISFESN